MRAGLSTIQQTLTPEAAAVLNQSIAEAGRRSHGQTTPLHVAATLLSSPAGYLRQACIKSHPNSSHPLQCRALELCFSVALERLPAAAGSPAGPDPPISNALMAALKRAQAHQRRGCPEQQQQPLLAVKVELEQLIISILDDPSVSRVMREASFSSPAVKAAIEHSLSLAATAMGAGSTCAASLAPPPPSPLSSGFGFRSAAPVPVPVPVPGGGGIGSRNNLYMNPKLGRGAGGSAGASGVLAGKVQREEDVKKVVDILMRGKKRNPVLVGEAEPEMVVKEVLRRVEGKELGEGKLKDVRVCRLEKEVLDRERLGGRIGELVEESIGCGGGIIFDLGDLKWLVEQPVGFLGPGSGKGAGAGEAGRAAVAEVGTVLGRHGGEGGRSVWLIGTATCETYLRCQVYHPTMENDWDLQAVPIAARNPVPGMFPRFAGSGLLGSSVTTLSPLKGLSTLAMTGPRLSQTLDPVQITKCCPQCKQNYEQELANITPKELDRSSVDSAEVHEQPLSQWLRNAKSQDGDNKDGEPIQRQKILELQKKWQDTCVQLHPGHCQLNVGTDRIQSPLSLTGLCNPITLSRQPFVPKMQLDRSFGGTLQLNRAMLPSQSPARTITPPETPVETDLALGRPKVTNATGEEGNEEITKDFLGLAPPKEPVKLPELAINKLLNSLDKDSFKRLLKGLLDKVPWQQEAAASVTTTITQCKMGSGKRRGGGSKGDIWLLFTGPDKVGKKKMASALSELVCGANPIMVSLGLRRDDGESDRSYRGKTALDQIVDAVKRNPFSVIMLEGIDEADMLVRGSIKRAIERGRLADSYGREISLGNVIFILTADWLPDNLKCLPERISFDEKRLASVGRGDWQLKLFLGEKTAKRRAHWLEEDRPMRPKKEAGLTFDLNETAYVEDDKADGSLNSSDLTVEREEEPVLRNRLLMPATSSISRELVSHVDDNIAFKPVDFRQISRDISGSITKKFATVMDSAMPVEIQEDVLEKIAGVVWLGRMGLEEWSDQVLIPSVRHLKMRLPSSTESTVVRLEIDHDSQSWRQEDIMPCNIRVAADGL